MEKARKTPERHVGAAAIGRHTCGHYHPAGMACPPPDCGWCGNPRCCH